MRMTPDLKDLLNAAQGAHEHGDSAMAESLLLQALALARSRRDLASEASATGFLAGLRIAAGHQDSGLGLLREAAALERALGRRANLASALAILGSYSIPDALDAAQGFLREALTLYREMDRPDGEARALLALGDAARHIGDNAEARGHYLAARDALEAAEDMPDIDEAWRQRELEWLAQELRRLDA